MKHWERKQAIIKNKRKAKEWKEKNRNMWKERTQKEADSKTRMK
jgi:hypothetical protein